MRGAEIVNKGQIFGVDDYGIHGGVVEDICDILLLQPIIDRYIYSTGCSYPKNTFQKRRCIRCEDAHAREVVFEEVVGQSTSAVGEFDVGASEDAVVCCDVVDGEAVGLDLRSAREEECW